MSGDASATTNLHASKANPGRHKPTLAIVAIVDSPSGKRVLTLEGISKSYGDNRVLDDVSLEVGRGERVAIIGPNGIGKSTLLKIALGEVRADAGEIDWGYETHPGYFAQDHRQQLLDSEGAEKKTVESWLWDCCPGEPIGFVRGQLGAVLFTKDEAVKRIGSLSGGEAARLLFCRHVVLKPNVLVLDEPTNHLDRVGLRPAIRSRLRRRRVRRPAHPAEAAGRKNHYRSTSAGCAGLLTRSGNRRGAARPGLMRRRTKDGDDAGRGALPQTPK